MNCIPENKNPISISKAREMNPLVLAYIGDSVQSLFVRMYFATNTTLKTNKLNEKVSNIVKAKSQALAMEKVLPFLTEEENDVYHRARNAHVNNVAKNASLGEYKAATAYESLIGYLYLTGQNDRLEYIMNIE